MVVPSYEIERHFLFFKTSAKAKGLYDYPMKTSDLWRPRPHPFRAGADSDRQPERLLRPMVGARSIRHNPACAPVKRSRASPNDRVLMVRAGHRQA